MQNIEYVITNDGSRIMPIYEYECGSCSHRFTKLKSMSEKDSELNCPSCNKDDVKRQISSFACSISASGGEFVGGGGGGG
jgi:putative FmdB family regulatory protein